MGYDGYEIEDALGGYEEELIERLDDRRSPSWAKPPSNGWDDALSWATRDAERTREMREERGIDRESTPTGLVSLEIKKNRAPASIREAIDDWLDRNKDRIEYRDGADFVEYRRCDLNVAVDPDGEVVRVNVSAVFKNH